MLRQFLAFLLILGVAITLGGLACADTVETLDKSDETDGAT